jgi:GMP synthase-like glutamine amidotransferase
MPTPAEAAGFDWILVSGSHYSVYEQHEWLQQLLELLPQYAATGVNIYGCCFGCQVGVLDGVGGTVQCLW